MKCRLLLVLMLWVDCGSIAFANEPVKVADSSYFCGEIDGVPSLFRGKDGHLKHVQFATVFRTIRRKIATLKTQNVNKISIRKHRIRIQRELKAEILNCQNNLGSSHQHDQSTPSNNEVPINNEAPQDLITFNVQLTSNQQSQAGIVGNCTIVVNAQQLRMQIDCTHSIPAVVVLHIHLKSDGGIACGLDGVSPVSESCLLTQAQLDAFISEGAYILFHASGGDVMGEV